MNRQTVVHQVATVLREEILKAELGPGVQLRQEEIAARLGVSTTPVREAFRILEGEGLVRLDPGRGVLVFRPSIKEVLETYEIRKVLEMLAIRHAVENFTEEDLNELQQILSEMESTSNRSHWIRLNNQYHDRMYASASRPRLQSMIIALRDSIAGYMHTAIQRAVGSCRAASEHHAILDACKAGAVERAQEAVRIHMHHTVGLALNLLEEWEAPPNLESQPAEADRTRGKAVKLGPLR